MIDIILRKLCLHREDLFVQPLIERQIIGPGAQERHGGVCVRILKSGHQEISVTVDLLLGTKALPALLKTQFGFFLCADKADPAALRP